jgi:hypothetical protein
MLSRLHVYRVTNVLVPPFYFFLELVDREKISENIVGSDELQSVALSDVL